MKLRGQTLGYSAGTWWGWIWREWYPFQRHLQGRPSFERNARGVIIPDARFLGNFLNRTQWAGS